MQFEYTQVEFSHCPSDAPFATKKEIKRDLRPESEAGRVYSASFIIDGLNELGAEGWEIVSVNYVSSDFDDDRLVYTFKREKRQDSSAYKVL